MSPKKVECEIPSVGEETEVDVIIGSGKGYLTEKEDTRDTPDPTAICLIKELVRERADAIGMNVPLPPAFLLQGKCAKCAKIIKGSFVLGLYD